METIYHYNKKNILQDYTRGTIGATLTGLPLFFLGLHPILMPIFLAGFGLFVFFLVKTFLRQKTSLCIDTKKEELIEYHLYKKKLSLKNLHQIKLRYYTTARRRTKAKYGNEPNLERGWFSLKLQDNQKNTIVVESSLEDFQEFLDTIIPYFRTTPVALNPATISNFKALGYDIDGHETSSAY